MEYLNFFKRYNWINKYTVVIFCFFIWMLFFDKHNWFKTRKLKAGLVHLQDEKAEYIEKLAQVKLDKEAFDKDVERFAREKYYMHKDNEEVFIIER